MLKNAYYHIFGQPRKTHYPFFSRTKSGFFVFTGFYRRINKKRLGSFLIAIQGDFSNRNGGMKKRAGRLKKGA